MTSVGDDRQSTEPQSGALRRRLAFALTAVALSMPIAGIFTAAWLYLPKGTSIVAETSEAIGLGIIVVLLSVGLADHIHRDRGTKP